MPYEEFVFGEKRLENDLVILEPFDPKKHMHKFHSLCINEPDMLKYMPFPEITTEEALTTSFYDDNFGDKSGMLFAVYDKLTLPKEIDDSDQSNYAGVMMVAHASADSQSTEMGIMIFPAFHRTHVTVNAMGLLICWLLDPKPKGGLGLRRVHWVTNAKNVHSRRCAERAGFELEGIARWQRCCWGRTAWLSEDVSELKKRNGTSEEVGGGHTAMYATYWDTWDEKRERVVKAMELRKK